MPEQACRYLQGRAERASTFETDWRVGCAITLRCARPQERCRKACKSRTDRVGGPAPSHPFETAGQQSIASVRGLTAKGSHKRLFGVPVLATGKWPPLKGLTALPEKRSAFCLRPEHSLRAKFPARERAEPAYSGIRMFTSGSLTGLAGKRFAVRNIRRISGETGDKPRCFGSRQVLRLRTAKYPPRSKPAGASQEVISIEAFSINCCADQKTKNRRPGKRR